MANILIVDDEQPLAEALATFFRRTGGHATTCAHSGAEAVERYVAERPDLVLLDFRLPDMTGLDVYSRIRDSDPVVIMITGHADVPLAVEAMQSGVENFLIKPIELSHLAVAADQAFEKVRLRRLAGYLRDHHSNPTAIAIGTSPVMRDLGTQVELLALSDRTTVLVLGEQGSGKGRVAESIHRLGPRRDQPFVEVSCAAVRGDALDTELFGAEAGPDGSRATRAGLLEVANGGTVFLDEIGDLDPALQAKLLRVLESRSFRRLGGTREILVDVRLIAATSKDLVTEVNDGRFREDLYYRLSVMPLHLPPLRARSRDDMVALIGGVVSELAPELPAAPRTIADTALDRLLRYAWPGNIRELRNVLERAMIIGRGAPRIEVAHLPSEVRDASGLALEPHVPRTLDEMERVYVERALRFHEGNRTHAARELGISRATLIKKIKQYGLNGRSAGGQR